jgi:hypothetical protein
LDILISTIGKQKPLRGIRDAGEIEVVQRGIQISGEKIIIFNAAKI